MNGNHPVVRDFILHCLRYWVLELRVDGFRFDLATILARGRNGDLLANPPVIEQIAEDPVLRGVKIIAEAVSYTHLEHLCHAVVWKPGPV